MPSILVIDDDLGTLECYRGILRVAGYDVVTAPSGREGLALARRCPFDLVLADLRLPDQSGLEILQNLQRLRIFVPFVVVTAYGTVPTATEALRLGADDYVEKPLETEALLQVVGRALARKRRARQPEGTTGVPVAHTFERWASLVVPVLVSPIDPGTLGEWARLVGKSASTIKVRCRAAYLLAKPSLDLARVLRVAARCTPGDRPEQYLNVADPSTLERLLRLGRKKSDERVPFPFDVHTLLSVQQFITDVSALHELRRTLEAAGFQPV